MKKKLKQLFSYSFDRQVWNILVDQAATWLVVALRKEENRETSFATISLKKKQLHSEAFIRPTELWWIDMSAIIKDMLLLHTYQDPRIPVKTTLIAYDLPTQRLQWQKNAFTLLSCTDEWLIGQQANNEVTNYEILHITTGKVRAIDKNVAQQYIARGQHPEDRALQAYPAHLLESEPAFATIQKFIQTKLALWAVKACDYLAYKGVFVISFYFYQEKKLMNNLVVVDPRGTISFHTTLDKELTGVGLGTFFVVQDQLIYLKGKNTIESYALQIH